jgi:uncharacterized membrane protein YeaQ/YmgE (transglycosylase-associated protein family)
MGILSWVLLGLIAGAIAKALHTGDDPDGWLVTIVIGIVGAVIGGYIGTVLGWGTVTGFNIKSILLAVGGALIVLVLFRALRTRRY